MLAWRIRSPLNRTLVGKALFALEEELLSLAATLTAFRVKIADNRYGGLA
jgi:hypothetical protein